jgi:hypothetical protein
MLKPIEKWCRNGMFSDRNAVTPFCCFCPIIVWSSFSCPFCEKWPWWWLVLVIIPRLNSVGPFHLVEEAFGRMQDGHAHKRDPMIRLEFHRLKKVDEHKLLVELSWHYYYLAKDPSRILLLFVWVVIDCDDKLNDNDTTQMTESAASEKEKKEASAWCNM